ncbi:MAG TPA: TetR/AcrR family transcriptional regulator [Vicinamibacteria bacterium]|nr:TetR/AcrR family transcriptional regulator [Vicinamibacteria bacterium]
MMSAAGITAPSRGSKGEHTRQSILKHALALSSQVGLGGLTIGHLAEQLGLSKSGLFAHFRSKEALQIQVLQYAAEQFVQRVVRPALTAPRGEPRVRAIFERWSEWGMHRPLPGGCVFVAAASELDDQPGPVRDQLVRTQREWLDFLATASRMGVEKGEFRAEADADQFAHDLYGIMLAFHHAHRLLGDPAADTRARRAFEALISSARAPKEVPR